MTNTSEYGVSVSGVIFWNVRDRLGRFVSRKVWAARTRLAAGRAKRAEIVAAYRCYLDARREAMESASRGHMLRDWLEGSVDRALKSKTQKNLTEEIIDWLDANGPTATYTEFSAAHREFYAQAA